MFPKLYLLLSVVVLSIGFLLLFFGGTWEGVRIGLEIFGAIWILQTSYSVLVQNQEEKMKEREAKKITNKYFNGD